ncbi:MAG: hypothetical protein HDR36_03365 [Treponema sp.]|nr:hypothetical protein [Treponema sp.]
METEQVKDKGKTGKTIKFILISGQTNVGKSNVCEKLHDLIYNDPNYTTIDKQNKRNRNPKNVVDFIAHYKNKNNNHYVVLNSASDNDNCMERLARYIDGLGARPDIIITSIRETGAPLCRMLALLEAIENGTKQLAQHYTQNIANATPTTLIRNVSLLHLTRQTASGNALAQYWSDNADDAKRELDLIV